MVNFAFRVAITAVLFGTLVYFSSCGTDEPLNNNKEINPIEDFEPDVVYYLDSVVKNNEQAVNVLSTKQGENVIYYRGWFDENGELFDINSVLIETPDNGVINGLIMADYAVFVKYNQKTMQNEFVKLNGNADTVIVSIGKFVGEEMEMNTELIFEVAKDGYYEVARKKGLGAEYINYLDNKISENAKYLGTAGVITIGNFFNNIATNTKLQVYPIAIDILRGTATFLDATGKLIGGGSTVTTKPSNKVIEYYPKDDFEPTISYETSKRVVVEAFVTKQVYAGRPNEVIVQGRENYTGKTFRVKAINVAGLGAYPSGGSPQISFSPGFVTIPSSGLTKISLNLTNTGVNRPGGGYLELEVYHTSDFFPVSSSSIPVKVCPCF